MQNNANQNNTNQNNQNKTNQQSGRDQQRANSRDEQRNTTTPGRHGQDAPRTAQGSQDGRGQGDASRGRDEQR
jgi:hypothetical protein